VCSSDLGAAEGHRDVTEVGVDGTRYRRDALQAGVAEFQSECSDSGGVGVVLGGSR
jgi:hypothetical protein